MFFFFFFFQILSSEFETYVQKVGCKLAYLISQSKTGINKELFTLQTCPQSPVGKIRIFGFLSLPAFACLCEKWPLNAGLDTYTANVCRDLQGLCREIGVRDFQIYEDCMYTRNRPCNVIKLVDLKGIFW